MLAVSPDKRKSRPTLTDVPELTAEEILARVLHRDGLMLVIDKPAGLPVHRGPKGGANLEASVRGAAIRPAAAAGAGPSAGQGYLRLPRAWRGIARRPPRSACCSSMARLPKTYWAVVEGGPAEDEGTDRHCRSDV